MHYTAARQQIRSGDLLAWSHYDWASWYDLQVQAVRIATQSEYCHVGLALQLAGRLFVLESVTPVVRMVPASNLVGDHGFYWLPLDVEPSAAELEFALRYVGHGRYSRAEAVKAQFNRVTLDDMDPEDRPEDAELECAKYVAACRRLSGRPLGAKFTPAAVVDYAARVYDAPVIRVTPDP